MADQMGTEAMNKPFYKTAETFEVLEEVIRDYEIEHTVHFTRHRGDKLFNTNHEPWVSFKGSLAAPKLMWVSDLVPSTGHPYISVSRKLYECQYGKQRKTVRKTSETREKAPIASYKIGCPCTIEIAEVLRLLSPKPRLGADGTITKHRKRELTLVYKNQFKNMEKGLPSELEFKREFHMTISPLSSHKHVIGEAAAEHQRVDPAILKRMHELAASGITAYDVIQDSINHYVEEVLFKGKTPPIKTNRRFYPRSRDIRNHVYLIKNQLRKQNKSFGVDNEGELAMAEDTILTSDILYQNREQQQQHKTLNQQPIYSNSNNVVGNNQYDNDPLQQSIYQLPHQQLHQQPHHHQQPMTHNQHYQPNQQYVYPPDNSHYDHYPTPLPQQTQTLHHQSSDGQPYDQVSSYCSVSTATATRKSRTAPVGTLNESVATTTSNKGWRRKRNSKEKFLCLVNKLNRIGQAIDGETDFTKLSTLLVNVIVQAKSLVPPDQVEILFQEEPRQLIYARRIRKYKPKRRHDPPKQRYPQINPEATLLPDKKELKAEAKKRELESRKKRAAEVKAAREKTEQLLLLKEKERIVKLLSTPTIFSLENKNTSSLVQYTTLTGASDLMHDGQKVLLVPAASINEKITATSDPGQLKTAETSKDTNQFQSPQVSQQIRPKPPMQSILKPLTADPHNLSNSQTAAGSGNILPPLELMDTTIAEQSKTQNNDGYQNSLAQASSSTYVSGGHCTSSITARPLYPVNSAGSECPTSPTSAAYRNIQPKATKTEGSVLFVRTEDPITGQVVLTINK